MFTVYIWLVILVDIPTLSSGCSAKQIYEKLFLAKTQRASAVATMRWRDTAPAYLIVVSFGDTKGRGVVADRDFQPGDFITYYHGKFLTQKPDGANSAYLFEVNDSGESTCCNGSMFLAERRALIPFLTWTEACVSGFAVCNLNGEMLAYIYTMWIFCVDTRWRYRYARQETCHQYLGPLPRRHDVIIPLLHVMAGSFIFDIKTRAPIYDFFKRAALTTQLWKKIRLRCNPPSESWPHERQELARTLRLPPFFSTFLRACAPNPIPPPLVIQSLHFHDGGTSGSGILLHKTEPESVTIVENPPQIDASDEDGSYGRLMNDDWRSPTAAYEVLRVDGQPRVAFFATRDIQRGEEITYNYGEDMSLPWRKQTLVTEAIRCLVIAPEYLLLADVGPPKGRGIIADKDFKEGEFITFYDGKHISEDIPHGDPYPFKHTPNEWIDASEDDGSYGRLLNDESKHPNARPEVADVDGQQYIAFYASRPIQRGEEITFSYNNYIGFPWRKKDAEEAIRELDISPKHLRVVDFGFPKGRGIVTEVDIEQDGFITFFHGNCVTEDPRNATYSLKIDANDKHIWIDATKEDGSYGRLINDDWRQPNARTETVTIDEETHVIFLANRPIERGEEIMYSYNTSSELLWRIKTPWEEAEDAIRSADVAPSSLLVVDFGHPKGRGVVAARDFKEGDYLTFYHGQHSLEEPSNDDKTYRFRIINNDGNTSWTDAFMEDGSYGRLINDEWRAALSNAAKTIIVVDGQQLIAFFASRAIPRGEEILFSYNDEMEFPWRKTEVVEAVRRSDSAPDYLAVVDFGQPKGKGIVAGKNFETDDFITFYAGERVFDESAVVNATHLHQIQQDDGDIWIDASKDDGSYGRLLNDDWRKPNARPESVTVDGVLHIAFFANRPIDQGDEIMFSYDSSMDFPWRKKEAEVAIRSKDIAPSYLVIVDFGQVKGRGVVAAKDFESGDFIAYLIGQRLSELAPDTDNSFLIEVETGGRFEWVDVSCDKVSSGRLINDDWVNPNADMYEIHVDGEKYITFFAIRDIQRGDEITFDYRRDNFWRKQDGLKEVDGRLQKHVERSDPVPVNTTKQLDRLEDKKETNV